MIDRYITKDMEGIFTDSSRFKTYLKVEIASLEAWSEKGVVPKEDVQKIKDKARVDVKRIKEIELVTKHDVVAFTRQISETLGDEKRWVHYGLTSNDVIDTSLSILYRKADAIITKDLLSLIQAVKEKAIDYKDTPCIGRTHGMHAEITSFGLKWANYYDELVRELGYFKEARKGLEAAKMSGAVGNYANVDPSIQEYVAKKFHLTSSNVATQVLSRDRHAYYGGVVALIGTTLEKIATEIRNLSRTEIEEVEEGFSKGQKGSSAMPQKRNPISSENITGCARLLRGYALPLYEDNSLYHERDISHSSVERTAFIDMIELFDYMVKRMTSVIDNLNVFTTNMEKNIFLTRGAVFSQKVLTYLIMEKGLAREKAYDLIQPLAMKAALKEADFKDEIKNSEELKKIISDKEVDDLFTMDSYFVNVDYIYKKLKLI